MNRSASAAAALLLGLCALFPTKAYAEEWRWCVAGDLLDSGMTNGPNLISRPFPADGAPDFQAQYEAYARSVIGPIQGEFIINCSPPFADHAAAVQHNGEWSLSMHDRTGGRFEAKDVFWDPVRVPSSATGATASDSRSDAEQDAVAANPAAAPAVTGHADAQQPAEPARPSTQSLQEDAARAEQRRQESERRLFAAHNVGASSDARAGADAAAKPLRFVMMIGLIPRGGDTHNSMCYSNIITRPGPPGWGAPGFGVTGSGDKANQIIDSLKATFFAKCRASGRELQSAGNFGSAWNQSEGDEVRLEKVHALFPEDVTVQID